VLSASKFSLLAHLLKEEKSDLAMVFCNTRTNADFVGKNLKLEGLKTLVIHGGFSQEKRTKTMEQFHDQDVDVLICTDVAARGLHIPNVSHIYNYDIPKDSKEYIHRIGRTARAGEKGKVINILTGRDHENFRKVLERNDILIKNKEIPEIKIVKIRWIIEKDSRGPRSPGGGRGRPPRGRPHGRSHSGSRDSGRDRNSRGPSRDRDSGRSHSRSRDSHRSHRR